jgi:lysophospholipase L1-like esterase
LELALLAASLMFSLLLAEAACRVYLYGPLALLPHYGNSVHPLGVSGLVKASQFPRVCFELKPGLDTIYKMVPFRTNSQGLVDREYSVQKPPGTCRVVVLGDSYTMPEGVRQEDAWHTLLEDEFNRSSRGKKYEFINFGVAGYTLDQYLATLEYRALRYSPDHVILGFCVASDIPKIGDKPLAFPYKIKPAEYPYFQSALWKVARRAWKAGTNQWCPKNRKWVWDPGRFDGKALQDSLVRLRQLGAAHGFKVTVVALRRANEHQYEYGVLKQAAARAGLPLIDAGSEFPDAGSRYWIYQDDRHPNAEANHIFARTIGKSFQLD